MKCCSIGKIEPKHNKMPCAPSEDLSAWASAQSDQSAVYFMGSFGPKLSSGGQQKLIRLGRRSAWSESSLGAQVILLVFVLKLKR